MISPGMSSCEHSLNTLRYADRVKELAATDPTEIKASPTLDERGMKIEEQANNSVLSDSDLAQLRSLNVSNCVYKYIETIKVLIKKLTTIIKCFLCIFIYIYIYLYLKYLIIYYFNEQFCSFRRVNFRKIYTPSTRRCLHYKCSRRKCWIRTKWLWIVRLNFLTIHTACSAQLTKWTTIKKVSRIHFRLHVYVFLSASRSLALWSFFFYTALERTMHF